MKITINDHSRNPYMLLDGGTADTRLEFRFFDKNAANRWEKLAKDKGFVCMTYVTGGKAPRGTARKDYTEEESAEFDKQLEAVYELERDLKSKGIYGYYETVGGYRQQGDFQYNNELSVVIPYCTLGMDKTDQKYRQVRRVGEGETEDAVAWVEDLAQMAHEHGQESIIVCMPRYFVYNAFYFKTSKDHPKIPAEAIRAEKNENVSTAVERENQGIDVDAVYGVGDSKKITDAERAMNKALFLYDHGIRCADIHRVCRSFKGYRVPENLGNSFSMASRGHLIATNNYDEDGNRLDFFLEPKETEHYDMDDYVVVDDTKRRK